MSTAKLIKAAVVALGLACPAQAAETWVQSPAETIQLQFERHYLQVFLPADDADMALVVVAEVGTPGLQSRAVRPMARTTTRLTLAAAADRVIIPRQSPATGQSGTPGPGDEADALPLSHE